MICGSRLDFAENSVYIPFIYFWHPLPFSEKHLHFISSNLPPQPPAFCTSLCTNPFYLPNHLPFCSSKRHIPRPSQESMTVGFLVGAVNLPVCLVHPLTCTFFPTRRGLEVDLPPQVWQLHLYFPLKYSFTLPTSKARGDRTAAFYFFWRAPKKGSSSARFFLALR